MASLMARLALAACLAALPSYAAAHGSIVHPRPVARPPLLRCTIDKSTLNNIIHFELLRAVLYIMQMHIMQMHSYAVLYTYCMEYIIVCEVRDLCTLTVQTA